MATVAAESASSPKAPEGDAEQKQCSTRELIEDIRGKVTAAQLEKDITSQKVTALEEHLKQLEAYDQKIEDAADAYGKGIGALCKEFDDLRAAVEQNKTQYQCLVKEDARTKIKQVLDDLRNRLDTLETCTWKLSQRALDTQCELDHGQAEVSRDEQQLDEMLARLDLRKKEVTDLQDITKIVDCSDAFSKDCRYAFYLDLEERLKIDCPTTDQYMCELVEQ